MGSIGSEEKVLRQKSKGAGEESKDRERIVAKRGVAFQVGKEEGRQGRGEEEGREKGRQVDSGREVAFARPFALKNIRDRRARFPSGGDGGIRARVHGDEARGGLEILGRRRRGGREVLGCDIVEELPHIAREVGVLSPERGRVATL